MEQKPHENFGLIKIESFPNHIKKRKHQVYVGGSEIILTTKETKKKELKKNVNNKFPFLR